MKKRMKSDQDNVLYILVDDLGPRIRYTFSLLFEWVYPAPYRLTSDRGEWEAHAGPRLRYSRESAVGPTPFLPAGPLLSERGLRSPEISVETWEGLPCFFRQPQSGAIFPFDLPAMAFYLASRYEEYLPFAPDVHGRFPAAESLAGREGFLRLPLINLWTDRLIERLRARFPAWAVDPPVFRFLPTFDIDLAWAFLHRPWWIQCGGAAKSALGGRWADLRYRWDVLRGRRSDPFFSFPLLRRLHPPDADSRPIFFYLLGDPGPYDKNIRPDRPALQALVSGLVEDYEAGIHLSYRSNREPDRIALEIQRLTKIAGRPPHRNRQHFLKLHLPETYRRLVAAGIREDYSMGFADDIGFRAGAANPFPWYDLRREETTKLLVYPFAVMDVTLKNYRGWTPQEAWTPVWEMAELTRRVGGLFCTLWHNSSFSDLEGWSPWISFYESLIREIKVGK